MQRGSARADVGPARAADAIFPKQAAQTPLPPVSPVPRKNGRQRALVVQPPALRMLGAAPACLLDLPEEPDEAEIWACIRRGPLPSQPHKRVCRMHWRFRALARGLKNPHAGGGARSSHPSCPPACCASSLAGITSASALVRAAGACACGRQCPLGWGIACSGCISGA